MDDPTVVTAHVEGVTQALTYKFTGKCNTPPVGTVDDFCGQTALQNWTSFGPTISAGLGYGELEVGPRWMIGPAVGIGGELAYLPWAG